MGVGAAALGRATAAEGGRRYTLRLDPAREVRGAAVDLDDRHRLDRIAIGAHRDHAGDALITLSNDPQTDSERSSSHSQRHIRKRRVCGHILRWPGKIIRRLSSYMVR